MESKLDASFDNLCRTCMHAGGDLHGCSTSLDLEQPPEEGQWKSIFDTATECGDLSITELLTSTIPLLKVQPSDELPKNICRGCLEHLLSAYRFQQMCIQSDQQMRELIALKMNKPFETQEPVIDEREAVRIVIEPMHNFPTEASSQTSNDPLKNNDASAMEHCKTTHVDVNDYLKMELDADDFDVGSIADYDDNAIAEFTTDAEVTRVRAERSKVEEYKATTDILKSNADCTSDVNPKTPNAKKVHSKKTVHNLRKEQQVRMVSSTHNCILCQKSFTSRRYLLKHLRRHKKWDELKNMPPKPNSDQDMSFKCDICGHYYRKPESLYKHRLTHDTDNVPDKQYICNLCEKVYGSQRTLTRHTRQRHRATEENSQEPTKVNTCKFCNKSFQQSSTLKDHLRTHTGEQPYLCSECGKAFNTSSNMKQHLLRHAGVKRYECPDCPKKFPCLSDLASHKAVHRRHKPHICDICGSAFGKPYQLKKHKMYHNGDKPYKCEYCEMRFVCMDHQRRHMRTHTGEKPYKCNYCERAFAQSNDLIKHLRTHLGENVYRCELCPSAFRLATELRIHFAMHKNEDEETRERNKKALMDEEAKLRLKVSPNKTQHLQVEKSLDTVETNTKKSSISGVK